MSKYSEPTTNTIHTLSELSLIDLDDREPTDEELFLIESGLAADEWLENAGMNQQIFEDSIIPMGLMTEDDDEEIVI